MSTNVVIPESSPLRAPLARTAETSRIVLFAGLPSVGKSLFLQQQALLAHKAGRSIHLLQYDVARGNFQTPEYLSRYPEVDGITHPTVRKAVSLWARQAVGDWHAAHPDPAHILIGEIVLIGGRLLELGLSIDDDVEPLLSAPSCQYFVPTPSRAVRQHVEAARAASLASPRHAREKSDAPIHAVQGHWQEIYELGRRLGYGGEDPGYDPDLYAQTFQYLLGHRHCAVLPVDDVLPVSGSVYDLDIAFNELIADPADVPKFFDLVERQYDRAELARVMDQWWRNWPV